MSRQFRHRFVDVRCCGDALVSLCGLARCMCNGARCLILRAAVIRLRIGGADRIYRYTHVLLLSAGYPFCPYARLCNASASALPTPVHGGWLGFLSCAAYRDRAYSFGRVALGPFPLARLFTAFCVPATCRRAAYFPAARRCHSRILTALPLVLYFRSARRARVLWQRKCSICSPRRAHAVCVSSCRLISPFLHVQRAFCTGALATIRGKLFEEFALPTFHRGYIRRWAFAFLTFVCARARRRTFRLPRSMLFFYYKLCRALIFFRTVSYA